MALMNLALRLQEAIATDADSLDIICMESSRLLELCRTLMQRGDLTTAAAINVDAGNIIGLCAKLAASDDGLPQALTLPPSDTLNELIILPAIAADQSTSTRQWLTLNLGDAPLEARLRAARDLRLAEPSNPVYVANHQSLETAAVSIWRSEVERCLDAEDAEAIQNVEKLTETPIAVFGKKDVRVELVEAPKDEPAPTKRERSDRTSSKPRQNADGDQEKKAKRSYRDSDRDDGPTAPGEWNGPRPGFLDVSAL